MGPRTPRAPCMPSLVQMAWLYRDPVGFLEQCRRRLGPVFRVDYPGSPPAAYVSEPELARALYAHDGEIGRAGEARAPYLEPVVGKHSLLCLEGEAWQRQRRLLAPALHGERIAGWRDEIEAIAHEEVARWPRGAALEVHPRMRAITLEIILRIVFGIRDAGRLGRLRETLPALLDALPLVLMDPRTRTALERPALLRIPGNPLRRFVRLRTEVDALLHDELARRRSAPDLPDRPDLLSMLLAAGDATDDELRDELLTLLLAGHETTATALAWTFERLARHPVVARRLRDELAGGDTAYLDAVIKEVLRTRPVVFDTPRTLAAPLELGGFRLPAGWLVAPAIPLVHRSRRLYGEPDRFDPDRFLADDPPVEGWIPFGGGRRRCIGSRLALLELQTIIPVVIARGVPQATSERDERRQVRGVTLAPGAGALVRLA